MKITSVPPPQTVSTVSKSSAEQVTPATNKKEEKPEAGVVLDFSQLEQQKHSMSPHQPMDRLAQEQIGSIQLSRYGSKKTIYGETDETR